MSISSLKEFASPVPVCQPNLELADLLGLFSSSGCDSIVVVSQEQRPLGVVNLRRVMPYLFSVTGLLKNTIQKATVDFQKPLEELQPPIIEPITILSAQLSLNQFCAYLGQWKDAGARGRGNAGTEKWGDGRDAEDKEDISHSPTTNNNSQQWVLVDEDGKFLGLLNNSLLLKSLAPSFTANDGVSAANRRQSKGLNVLVQLLEQLPLPLSLQTSTGQVIAQNSSWRQQIGTSPDLDWVKYTSTVLGADRLQQQCQLPGCSSAPEIATALLSETTPFAERVALMSTLAVESYPSEASKNLAQQGYNPKAKASDCFCRIDVPYQRRLLAPPMLTTNVQHPYERLSSRESSLDSGAKLSESQGGDIPAKIETSASPRIDKRQSSFFSFVRTPLSPSVASLQDWIRVEEEVQERALQGENLVKKTGYNLGEELLPNRGTNRQSRHPYTESSSPSSTLWLVLAQDTTEQQQVTQELAAKNADLVQLNRLKDEFLACISHELKTPLTAVLGLSKLLKDQALGKLNERQARYAQLIYQSGRQLMTVVNDILDLTRIETGQLQLTLDAVKIQAICDRAYAQAQQRLVNQRSQEEGATQFPQFNLQIEPDLEVIVADELRLCQMLVHLLENALKFTDSNGEIGLTVNHWEGWIAFTVWDNGIGIPEEKQHLIFQKFQQLEEPLTRRFDGTGLGLVLTQRLAHLHGGDISFISKPDEGSQFTLLLPPCPPQEKWEEDASVREKQETRIPYQNISKTEGAQGKGIQGKGFPTQQIHSPAHQQPTTSLVLIVETVPQYLANLNEQLQGLGYHVVIARAGTEAVEKARRLQPCAIFLNPLLPRLSGWDVLTLLKSNQHTHHIPVFVTATQAEKRQAYHHKADGFLTLPVQEQALIKTLAPLAKPQIPTGSSLTILYLTPVATHHASSVSPALSSELTNFLNLQHSQIKYRILEADDLEQAEILTRVWHPDVLLLDSEGITEPLAYLQQLSQYESLTSLPLVTLNHKTTEAANQVSSLCVYPCLAVDNSSKVAALLQVVQVAAGMSHKPNVLVINIGETGKQGMPKHHQSPIPTSLTPQSSWRQALMQYLQTAGFRGLLASSWVEVYRQLQTQNFDLLLIRLTQIQDSSMLAKRLNSLAQLQKLPPVLILDHRLDAELEDKSVTGLEHSTSELESLFQGIATQVLRGYSQSMSQLLAQIKQILARK
ncbi:MAG: response regulator [Symploca sp. SIO2G7]|nr:response regulator [Symploca sp. SIO2G7]